MEEIKMKNLTEFRCPRWEQLPDLDLYMDQVVNLIEMKLIPLFGTSGEKNATSTMINNYVKQRIIPAPQKKKYSKKHLAQLFVLFIMKKILSIPEITALISYMDQEPDFALAYDKFCDEIDTALQIAFAADSDEKNQYLGNLRTAVDSDSVYRAMSLAFACKMHAQRILSAMMPAEAPDEKKKEQDDGE